MRPGCRWQASRSRSPPIERSPRQGRGARGAGDAISGSARCPLQRQPPLGQREFRCFRTAADRQTPQGSRVPVRGCDHWEFRDGKVVRKDSYWKLVEIMKKPLAPVLRVLALLVCIAPFSTAGGQGGPATPRRLTVLVDAFGERPALQKEWGYSALAPTRASQWSPAGCTG